MKFLVVGLGNIGDKYENTRHNIGFKILDALAEASSVVFEPGKFGRRAEVKHRGRKIVLIKPDTFMNLSGKAVRHHVNAENVPLEKMLIVTDDLALPFGTQRLRTKGSDGGHNGLKSINELLGTSNYPRLRFGIGSEFGPGQQVNYVLDKWSASEAEKLAERIKIAIDTIKAFSFLPTNQVMSDWNGK